MAGASLVEVESEGTVAGTRFGKAEAGVAPDHPALFQEAETRDRVVGIRLAFQDLKCADENIAAVPPLQRLSSDLTSERTLDFGGARFSP